MYSTKSPVTARKFRKALSVVSLSLMAITSSVAAAVPASADSSSFAYTVDADGNATVTGYIGTAPQDLVIPSTVDGHPVTAIGNQAFSDNQFASLVIPDTVTRIEMQAFIFNPLVSVSLGKSVGFIGYQAFSGTSLTSMQFKGNAPTIQYIYGPLIDTIFWDTTSLTAVDVPCDATGWGATFSGKAVRKSEQCAPTITSAVKAKMAIQVAFNVPTQFNANHVPVPVDRVAYSINGSTWITWGLYAKSTQLIKGIKRNGTYFIRVRVHGRGGSWSQPSSSVSVNF